MANLTTINLTSGASTDTGTVSSLDNLLGNASVASANVVTIQRQTSNLVTGCISTAMTVTTTTALLTAPATALRNYITTVIVSNAHATQGTDVVLQDGSAGTTFAVIPAAPAYGGAVVRFDPPLAQPTTAKALYCANVTSGASTKVTANGYTGT